ncbi:MAG TPA: signal peptidase II [Candidatus Limnocylindrales bacterium]|nr:signal peptidase II [Candidatus Limnocylindrales bacterium]
MIGTVAGVAIAATVAIVDLASKGLAHAGLRACAGPPVSACDRVDLLGPFGLLRTTNDVGAFGIIGDPWLWPLLALALVGLGAFLRWSAGRTTLSIAAALLMGGFAANLLDRAVWGAVTDFIDVRGTGADSGLVLNLADLALAAGGLTLVAAVWRGTRAAGLATAPPVAVLVP